ENERAATEAARSVWRRPLRVLVGGGLSGELSEPETALPRVGDPQRAGAAHRRPGCQGTRLDCQTGSSVAPGRGSANEEGPRASVTRRAPLPRELFSEWPSRPPVTCSSGFPPRPRAGTPDTPPCSSTGVASWPPAGGPGPGPPPPPGR